MNWPETGMAFAGGSFLPVAFRTARRWFVGSAAAETRKINADADNVIIGNLTTEVTRLSREIDALRTSFEKALSDNRKLAARVRELETTLNLPPNTPEFQAKFDAIDRKTGGDK